MGPGVGGGGGWGSAACGVAGCLWHSRMPVAQLAACGISGCLRHKRIPVAESDAYDIVVCSYDAREVGRYCGKLCCKGMEQGLLGTYCP